MFFKRSLNVLISEITFKSSLLSKCALKLFKNKMPDFQNCGIYDHFKDCKPKNVISH